MAQKHGTAAVSGITTTGVYIQRVRKVESEVAIESMGNDGAFGAGKGLRKRTDLTIAGEQLTDASLAAAGSGAATSVSPRVTSVTTEDLNEQVSTFEVAAHFYSAGSGNYGS